MTQVIKKNWVYILFVFAVVFFVVQENRYEAHSDRVYISLKTIHAVNGWGYEVYTNDSLYIRQEYIPAIEGRKGFVSATEARLTGQLVMQRMEEKGLPVITLADLDSLHITR